MPHQVADYIAAGMTGFVAKPINIGELLAAMDAAIAGGPAAVGEIAR